jgi:hypothetical protein
MLTLIAETIEWHDAATDKPDCDTTCLIELDPAGDYGEPVWLGYHDGRGWLDVTGDAVEVIAWAQVPAGSRAAPGVGGPEHG